MLTLRQIRYFQTLAETHHFGRAARRLNISQPALSGQIAQLEDLMGTALFTRGPAGVFLTADGELVADRVRRILTEVRDLESLADRKASVLGSRLRVGMIATVAPYLLPRLLPVLAAEVPGLECQVRESITERLIEDLKNGEIDCAVLAEPLEAPDVETITLFDDPFHLAVPANLAATLPDPVPLHELSRQRMILLEEGHCLRTQALDICRIAGDHELARLGATSLTTILRMVAGGLGATLIPDMAVADEAKGDGIAIMRMTAPAPSRRLVLTFRPTAVRRNDYAAFAEILCRSMDKASPLGA
ncbi:LysR substrate-binding domain-containing protein [Jiella sp. MQZ9-1]|uniref:LysR family transcriptional regulator n=1 Tax=Jiella flava TaxID=2816857 RepID=A0A939FX60_9HYPH|nr:LysR substrate-binding domain-containing protein [Jiella flava]MBO0662386.1 LysR family transcriptional regulator [Jiella flava]MCD2471610.1 LysR substrate-binding domain-containing protein [Jiella flava]